MKIKLFVLLLLSCLTTQADDVVLDGIKYSLNLKKLTAEVTGYDKELSGDVNILSEVTIKKGIREYKCKVTSIGISSFANFTGMLSITIPNSVTNIGRYAFSKCSGLTSIAIPNSLTDIGENIFMDCSSLTSVDIPSSVKTIGENSFKNCSLIINIYGLPNSLKSFGLKKQFNNICP